MSTHAKPYEAYPLHWPTGWPRTAAPSNSKFGDHSITRALDFLKDEIARIDGHNPVVSSNVTLGNMRPKDCGVAVYFQLKKRPVSLACDKWNRVEHNLWALAKHIEAIRSQERWGVGTIEQAFGGYMQLPAPTSAAVNCWALLGLEDPKDRTKAKITERFKALAQDAHPDKGGNHEQMQNLNAARESALASL